MRNLQTINQSKINYSAVVIAGFICLLCVASLNALDKKNQLKLGEIEYLNNCAACHGRDAKGGGPVAAALITKPYDLTLISKKFDGKFPKGLVYKIINGHEIIKSHGDMDLQVWGDRYSSRASEVDDSIALPFYEQDNQAMVFGRITSLVGYLESIQAK